MADRIDQKRNAANMVQVRVGDEDMVDPYHFVESKITDASAGIDEHVVVEQHGGCAQVRADAATTPQNFQLHIKNSI
ncbi:hypothetical protein ACFQAT_12435 [Undibacterium arcticum]|uniref:hypothetical protein n=1 Tax=Undibacterium arcticum TaxID=1762892 RepID=UPI003615F79B